MGLLGQRANRFIILEDVAKLPPVGTGLAYTLQQYMSVPVSTGHVLPVDFTFLSLTTSKFDYLFICWRATRFFFFLWSFVSCSLPIFLLDWLSSFYQFLGALHTLGELSLLLNGLQICFSHVDLFLTCVWVAIVATGRFYVLYHWISQSLVLLLLDFWVIV